MKKLVALSLALILVFGLCACGASKTEGKGESGEIKWPNGKMTIYCPANTGDPLDMNVRCWADAYAAATGGEYEIVNEGTGDGERLFQMLKKAKPDGMTMLIGGAGQIMQYYAGVHADNPADPSCFTIVGPTSYQATMGAVLFTQPNAPYNTVEELAEYAKAHSGELTCALSSGTSRYLAMSRLLDALGIKDDVRIVEASSSETTTGLLGDTINIALMNDQYTPQYAADGSLKPIILTRIDRNYDYIAAEYKELMDAIPTFSDCGLEDYVTQNPMCIFGPAGMSDELCDYIMDKMSILGTDEWAAKIKETQGGSACYPDISHAEMVEIVKGVDAVCADVLG